MTDPDLTERIAEQLVGPDWVDTPPNERSYWRGIVAAITQLLAADRARPWPRIGTLDPATLEELDTHGRQAMEAVEQ